MSSLGALRHGGGQPRGAGSGGVDPAKAVRAFGVETLVPGVVLAEFSRGQGVGAVPAKKTAKKAKSKKVATKASQKGGQVVWSVDDHQYN